MTEYHFTNIIDKGEKKRERSLRAKAEKKVRGGETSRTFTETRHKVGKKRGGRKKPDRKRIARGERK